MLHERANGLREEDYGYMTMGGIFQSLSETKDFDKAINVLSDRDNWLANPVRMSEPLHILENLHKLIGSPLFSSGQIDHRGAARKDVLESLLPNANQYPEARFWLRWYQGLVRGDKPEVRILQDIALIPAEDWERGPEHIARLIEEIEARHELKARIAELEDELSRASINRHGIGGNYPPKPATADIADELWIIWAPLQELKGELEKNHQLDPHVLRKIITALLTGLKTGIAWCGSKIDLAIDSSIRWAIPATGGGYLAMNPEKLDAVIKSAKVLMSLSN